MPYKKVRVDSPKKPAAKKKTHSGRATTARRAKASLKAAKLSRSIKSKPKKLTLREAADKAAVIDYTIKDHKTGKMVTKPGNIYKHRPKDL